MAIRKGNEISSDRTVKTIKRPEAPPKLAKGKSDQIGEEKKFNGEETKLRKSTSSQTEKLHFSTLIVYILGKKNIANQLTLQTSLIPSQVLTKKLKLLKLQK